MKYCFGILFFFNCASVYAASDVSTYQIQVQSNENIAFENAKIKVKLYGTHRFVMDNGATLVDETVSQIQSLPSKIKLNWSSNAYRFIQNPEVQNAKDAIYYLKISIDANNDGKFCRGDFRQNFKLTPFATFDEKPVNTLVFNLVAIESEICEAF